MAETAKIRALLRWLLRFRVIRNIPARIIGYGFRQVHVRIGEGPPAPHLTPPARWD